ncbi:hypothetical protein SBOR_4304 [Sclerotinia borealis F-4128]|uniref:C3H1-type domain-containing protein n=1 Tax=Sclerotinia borealis (strain F-4128) TaxID=1432307 RepID=W9CF00_SCLBF|nr:hypothetical protein SBOR_4304 [Sclerotinia borealis F-4128]
MSDYPYYGATYGSRDQTNNPPYPTYPTQAPYYQQDDGHSGQHAMTQGYDNTMAYGYNQQLPNYSAPAMQNNIPQVPVFQGWNQENSSMPQYSAMPQGMQSYAGYNHQNYAQNSQYYAPVAVPQPTYHSQTPVYGNTGDREMSEGEYDDTSAHMHTAPPSTSVGAPGTSHYRGNDGNGYLDTAHRAVYPASQDPTPQQPPNLRNGKLFQPLLISSIDISVQAADYYTRSQPSDSYSPFVPQSEPVFDQAKNTQNKGTGAGKEASKHNKKGSAQKKEKTRTPVEESTDTASKFGQESLPSSSKASASRTAQADARDDTVTFKSVGEARKKAEGAILNLWTYDVRFPAYIEEGVDEKLVGELFDELRLSKTASKTVSATSAQSPSTSISSAPTSTLPVTSGQSNGQAPAQNSAADKHKQAVINTAVPALSTTTQQTKSAAAVEKEKTMQAKMDALRKSRAERAQKNAAKSSTSTILSIPLLPIKPAAILGFPSSGSIPTSSTEKIAEKDKVGSTVVSSAIQAPALTVATQLSKSDASPSTIQQSSQKIPGLFLAAATLAPPFAQNLTMPTPATNGQRKRPVAADFDGPATSSMPFKRPFGHSRTEQKSFVICVSEDEDESDEDVEMELESQADADSPVQPSRKLSDQRALPTSSSFLPPKPFTPPPISSASTLPALQTSIKPHPEDLRRKESEIEQLKRKIAEAEMRKANKRSGSGVQTPVRADTSITTSSSNIGVVANKADSSTEIQKAIDIAKDKLNSNQQQLAAAQAAELQKAAEIRKEEAETKRLRRERIASAIPRVDAEALQNQSKLEELRAETARIEAAMQKNLQDKQKLLEEMERLGQETDQQLQEQKEKLDSLTREETKDNTCKFMITDAPLIIVPTAHILLAQPRPVSAQPDREPEPQNSTESVSKSASVPMELDEQVDDARDAVQQQSEQPYIADVDAASPIPVNPIQINSNSDATQEIPEGRPSEVKENSKTNQDLEAALQEAVRADADSASPCDIEMEDGNAEPVQIAEAIAKAGEQKASSDYSPVLERSQPLVPSPIPDTPEVTGLSEVADVESDNYEPPEATPPVDETLSIDSPPFSPAPPDSVIDEPEDIEFEEISNGNPDDVKAISNGAEQLLPVKNGSVLQLTKEPVSNEAKSSSFFSPYESPLKLFHAFRFHAQYKQQIPGGLKSMTYTNKIDAKKELCRYELMGGICNDNTCEFQHFREMGLPDDAVLTELGSPDEFEGEYREKFIEGLKTVLSGLRARKIKDFDAIASEIIAHRANFLGDSSKVLSLEGTTI